MIYYPPFEIFSLLKSCPTVATDSTECHASQYIIQKAMIKYFIEHIETRLWVYFETDYSKPNFISSFNGSRIRMPGHQHKVLWTNDPNKAEQYNSEKDALDAIRSYVCRTPDELLIVTEHEFI